LLAENYGGIRSYLFRALLGTNNNEQPIV